MNERKKMRVTENFNHLMSLLADSLYTTSDVFVRELVQNGHDGIVRRQAKERGYRGEIHIDYDTASRSILFTDNGEGMNRDDIEKSLSVIGSVRTETFRQELGEAVSLDLIGQFGIGILSAFAAGREVTLETRKMDSTVGFRWTNKGSIEYELTEIERVEIGTTVTVQLKQSFTWLLDSGRLKDLLIHYCDFIAVPLYVNGDGPINVIRAPWDRETPFGSKDEERTAYLQMVSRRFPDRALEVCPLNINVWEDGALCRTRGALYIPDRRPDNDGGTIDIFIRRMLVKEHDKTLLPSWAGFLRGVVDSPDLRPNTGRDNVNQESPAYHILQRELENAALNWLTGLAKERPDDFNKACRIHSAALKGLALVNERFFDGAAAKLRFTTSSGELSLEEYLSKSAPQKSLLGLSSQRERRPIRYYTNFADAGSYERLAREKGYLLIRATDPRDAELLEMYAARHLEVVLERFNGLDKRLFRELSQEGRERFAALESRMVAYLTGADIDAETRTVRFAPSDAPADIVESANDKTFRELRERLDSPALAQDFKDAFEPLRRGRRSKLGARPGIQLALNADNKVIQSLAELAATEPESPKLPVLLSLLWRNALLYADRIRGEARERLHDDIARLMEAYLESGESEPSGGTQSGTNDAMDKLLLGTASTLTELGEMKETHRKTRDELAALRESLQKFGEEVREQAMKNTESQRSEHITLFMITPFKGEYEPIRRAVKRVFECEPFCFEVQIATDQYGEAELRRNIRYHMNKAHGFIAEISEQNANVMMEIGAVLMSGDERFLFPLEIQPRKMKELADVKGLLTFGYPGLDAPSEEIESAIRNHVYRHGEIINDKLRHLIATKRKALYLSDTLLEYPHTRLSEEERPKVLEEVHPHTVEAFLEANTQELAEKTKIDLDLLAYAQKHLREVKRKCDNYAG